MLGAHVKADLSFLHKTWRFVIMPEHPEQLNREFRFIRALAKLALAVGGPVIGWVGGAAWVRQHPWTSLIVIALYEVSIFSLQIANEVWGRLKGKWLDMAARSIDVRLQWLVSGYRRSYLKHVAYECRDFDVKGLSTQGTYTLELEQVFVQLSVDAKPSHAVSQDIVPTQPDEKLPSELLQGVHDIWDYLGADRSLAVIGAPGSGKTTLLRHIALTVASGKAPVRAALKFKTIPVLLYLRSHSRAIDSNVDVPLHELVKSGEIVKEMSVPCPEGWVERQLETGACLILLDGLDEVADVDVRKKVVRWVEKQIRTHRNNLFVITSRPHGYHDNPLNGVTTLAVNPFDDRQVNTFIKNWYLSNEIVSHNRDDEGVRHIAELGARDLIRRIRSSDVLIELSVNPLLLTMIATVHRFRSELPARRVELYQQVCEVFLGKRQDVRGVERPIDLTPSQKQCVLEPLAYEMMIAKKREFKTDVAAEVVAPTLQRVSPKTTAQEFFKMIENGSGLLLERESGEYGFAHKTFQEYLASAYCKAEGLEEELTKHVQDDWWHETIRLYVAQSDATSVVEACLAMEPPTLSGLVLAVECLGEAQQIGHSTRQKVERVLAFESQDAERERTYAEALLTLRLRRMTPIHENCWIDFEPISNAEFQMFVNDMREDGLYHQPDHWRSSHFVVGEGAHPVSGVRASDAKAFCNWLTKRGAVWFYRLPYLSEIEETPPTSGRTLSKRGSVGCWVVDSPFGANVISGLSPQTKESFVDQARAFIKDVVAEDYVALAAYLARDPAQDPAISRLFTKVHKNEGWSQDVLLREFQRARSSSRDQALDLATYLARDLVRGVANEFDLSRILNIASDLALINDFRLDRALTFDLDVTTDPSLEHYLDVACTYARSVARNIDPSLAPRFDVESAFNRLHLKPLQRRDRHAYVAALSRVRTLERLRSLSLAGQLSALRDPDSTVDGRRVRAIALFIAGMQRVISGWLHGEEGRYNNQNPPAGVSDDNWLDVYIQLALAEGRSRGKVRKLGGVCIVRERRIEGREF